MSMTTYVVRTTKGFETRTSATMAYTHAILASKDQGPVSWHTSAALAQSALGGVQKRFPNAKVVPVEAHEGGKQKVERALRLAAEAQDSDLDEVAKGLNAALTDPALKEHATKTSAPKAAPAKAAAAPKAGVRTVPAEAANAERQAYVAEVGIAKYRNQYNGGWDAATAGSGAKNAASGKASLAWMDGYLDRTANPGKAGIASKWAALRSTEAPVLKVEAPAPAEAPAAKAEKAPSAPAKAKAKGKAKA
jgi:hypothetical protein